MRKLNSTFYILLSTFLYSPVAFATFGGELTNPFGNCKDLSCLAGKLTKFLLTIAPAIATIMILVGAFQMITAGGNPEQFSKGKKTLLYAAIGLAVVLMADAIIALVTKTLS